MTWKVVKFQNLPSEKMEKDAKLSDFVKFYKNSGLRVLFLKILGIFALAVK